MASVTKKNLLPYIFDTENPVRVGLLPTDATDASNIQYFDLPPHNVAHVGNAWEEDGKVIMYATGYRYFSYDLGNEGAQLGGV